MYKEAIFLLLTGIGDDYLSTVDACNRPMEMWIAIERLQERVNHLKRTRCKDQSVLGIWEVYFSRWRINGVVLLTCIPRHKGKEIAKPVTPQSESVSEEDSDPEQAQRDKDMQKNLALLVNSDLAPQRQEMSVENVSSGLVPQGQKASDYDNSDLVSPRQNDVPTAEKTDSSQQGLEFLFSPLLEEYYNPAHGHAEDNNNDQAPNASFQEAEFINPFCTRVQEIGESSSRNIDNTL
ncbi:hypothetical protein Tco_1094701 [Tanacetum coccineum]|uniref:Uncharacterized protein n=1 Tax=Tanacetum coccineum TaxID=301880 RepID=A0ABQ5IG89_9ASTR